MQPVQSVRQGVHPRGAGDYRALAEKYDTTYVITDEVYEHIVFAPNKHLFSSLPGMWGRTLSCSSLSKTYSVTGWRLGYIIAPAGDYRPCEKKVHDFLTVGAAAPLQEAVVTGLKFGQDYYDDLQAKYTHKKDLFLKGSGRSQNRPYRPAGRVLCSARHCRVRLRERSCVLRGSGALCRRRRGSRIELLP